MSEKTDGPLRQAKKLLKLLKDSNIDITEAYIFGSTVTGNSDPESDIDVAIISKDFEGIPYYDIQKVTRQRRNVDLRLEVHPFAYKDVKSEPPHFLRKIRETGIKINA